MIRVKMRLLPIVKIMEMTVSNLSTRANRDIFIIIRSGCMCNSTPCVGHIMRCSFVVLAVKTETTVISYSEVKLYLIRFGFPLKNGDIFLFFHLSG